MKRFSLGFTILLVLAVFSLNSCSGLPQTNGTTPPGTANLTLTVTDAPPAGVSFLSFNVPVTSVSLTSSTGAVVNVVSPATPIVLDMVRLQSDSAALGTFKIPSDTYTKLTVSLGVVNATFANTTGATIGTCAAGAVCSLNSGTPPAQIVTFASPIVVAGNASEGLNLDFNLNNAVTTANGITIDFTQTNILTIPNAPVTTGNLNAIEDFTGVVTAFTNNNVTITSGTRGTLTGAVNSSTTYNGIEQGANPACTGNPNAACLAVNKTVSVDATLSAAGVVTITEVDFLDTPFIDEIEGVIFPTSTAGTYNLIVSDKVNATNNSLLNAVSAGARIAVTLDTSVEFDVDTRNLLASVPAGFTSNTDIFPGQEVMVHVKTATSGTLLNVLTDRIVLRYTRTTGTVNTVSATTFSVNNLPPFLGNNFTVAPSVQTFSGVTTFDGFTTLSDLATGNPTVSFRALYLNPNTAPNGVPFDAAKVRKH
ncbi:MAG TPA: DUF4382 domain-containing protein [Candidatus Acidoferrum sp.]|nr:DUF4382 domain-containing protein [Candidatus Acidoferrum sp.]